MTQQKKQRILVIVESPAKVPHIQKYLNKDIECEYIVVATKGHIVDLYSSEKFRLGVDIENDFTPKYTLVKDKKDRLQLMIDEAIKSDKILIATDNDREGECIGALVRDRLVTCNKPIKRVFFSEIVEDCVLKSVKKEFDIDENLVQAAKARRVLDRIVGYLASPFLIQKLGSGVSAGRVQSVALRLIVEREREIENFVPETYYVIKSNLYKEQMGNAFDATLITKNKIQDLAEAESIVNKLNNSKFIVKKITRKEKLRPPSPPLNTSKMLIIMSNKLGLSPTETMDVAQQLFENGIISYHRTDSVRTSKEMVDKVRDFISNTYPNFLPKKPNVYKNKDNIQDGHEAIRPTNINNLPLAKPITNKDKVYKIIWEVFVASQMTPAVYDTTSIVIEAGKYSLKVNGRILKDQGWLNLIEDTETEVEDNSDKLLPNMEEADVLNHILTKAEEKRTTPPSRYKQATLVSTLEHKNIGRPSTYAPIVAKLLERKFVEIRKNVMYPSTIGCQIVDVLMKYFEFMEYNYTALMEEKLDKIAGGELKYVETMKSFYEAFIKEINDSYRENIDPNAKICEKCNSVMLLRKGKFGYFLGCSNYPNCTNTIACTVENEKVIVDTTPKEYINGLECPKCSSKMYKRIGYFGEYYCCDKFPGCRGSRPIPTGYKCPNCNADMYKKKLTREPIIGVALCCSNYPRCKMIVKIDDVDGLQEKIKKNNELLHKKWFVKLPFLKFEKIKDGVCALRLNKYHKTKKHIVRNNIKEFDNKSIEYDEQDDINCEQ